MGELALVTGFAGYGGRSLNPAGEAAKALDGRRIGGLTVVGRVLPVDYRTLQSDIQSLMDEVKPRLAIGLGLWPGEAAIRLERVAVNLADFEIPDNAGSFLAETPISGNAGPALMASLPLRRIQGALLDAGIPARISSSAGTFLCNATLFALLAQAQRMAPPPLAGFVHLPYLPEQVATLIRTIRDERVCELHQRADLASMDLATSTRALTIAIETSASALP
jgi:pyroglutamyl-peptidase